MTTITFTEAEERFLLHLGAARRSTKTAEFYAFQFRAFRIWAETHGIGDVLPDAAQCDEFLADSAMLRLRPATVHARWRALRSMLNWCEKRGYLAPNDNPTHVVDAPAVPQEIRRFVPQADADRLLASIGAETWLDHRDRLIVALLYYSGLRLAELCKLQIGDVDTATRLITVRLGKGGRDRIVPAHPELITLLLPYLYTRPTHSAELLLASDGWRGTVGPLAPEGVRQMLIRRCRAAGIPIYNPHAFRHGYAMMLLANGVRMSTISEAMGHADLATTSKVYAKTTIDTVRAEYDEALRRSGKGGTV